MPPDFMIEAEQKLGHPLRRPADQFLAIGAIQGHLGRVQRDPIKLEGKNIGDLSLGLELRQRRMQKRGFLQRLNPFASTQLRVHKRWSLYRAHQVDQNGHPACVGATEEHWEKSLPVGNRRGLGYLEMYRLAKLNDGWPGEDGTDAVAMARVCKTLGLIESEWWWTGKRDTEAARVWLETIGPLWIGAYIPESMFRTSGDGRGYVDVVYQAGKQNYGHEMMVIGYDRKHRLWEIVNSWGLDRWGVKGRGFCPDEGFQELLANGGDLVGFVEKRNLHR